MQQNESPNISIREIQPADIPLIIGYWRNSDKNYLLNMGVDLAKIPSAEQLTSNLQNQIATRLEQKNSYCLIWLVDGIPVGHSNTNPMSFGKEAFMHLHLWNNENRARGLGWALMKLTLAMFFEKLQLKDLYCQPYALNPAPNRTLEKLGFKFVKEYITVPGSLNFEQPVKLWHMSYENFIANNNS